MKLGVTTTHVHLVLLLYISFIFVENIFNDFVFTYVWISENIVNYGNVTNIILERKEGNVLFNDALNTFCLRLYGVGHIVKDHSDSERLTARVLLYAPSHRQDSTYNGLCYTSRGALAGAGTRNSSVGPPHEGSIRRPIAP